MGTPKSRRPTFQLFDLLGKYIYEKASPIGTINSIRGIFKGVSISPGIQVILGRTENVRKLKGLERLQGDLFFEGTLTEPEHDEAVDFLVEFQIKKERKLGIRVFNYGQAQSQRNATVSLDGGVSIQRFPEAGVIYLGPPPYPLEKLIVETAIQGSVIKYEIPVYSVLAHTLEEMEQDGLHLLTPFLLLQRRKEFSAFKTSKERREEIIGETLEKTLEIEAVLERGCTAGIIMEADVAMMLDVMESLYNELYQEGNMDFAEQLKKRGFHLKYPEMEARFKAEKEAAVRQTAQERDAKIFGLWRQGYTPEEAERLLSQEATSNSPQQAMT